ncbi:MAG: hypothetical protein M3Y42_03560 [Actinomycetota bacterium]|nr:hypothetical protein [Actinomycetota bacterium]
MPILAGAVDLAEVMQRLAADRPIFHSEADFQFAFAWTLKQMASDAAVRLEVPHGARERLDLLCSRGSTSTVIEFKYFTAAWAGPDPRTLEPYRLKSHAADDLLRLHYVHDLTRLERYVRDAATATTGIALVLSNHSTLWSLPQQRELPRYHQFRIHEGRQLSGKLIWGTGDYPLNDRTLTGSYEARWKPYSQLPGRRGEFRWLGLAVG